MEKRNIIVIGASAGGFDVIKTIVAGLPPDLDAAIFIVWHIAPDVRGVLPQVINKFQTLSAAHAVDREPVRSGRIYVAPPDHHMLLEKGRVRITKGPKENRFRPAIDPLFRSAAYHYGPRVIGVVLSGALDDGSAGLWTIREHGGVAVVQDPADAEVPSMPQNALRAAPTAYILPVTEIAAQLVRLSEATIEASKAPAMRDRKGKKKLDITSGKGKPGREFLALGELSPYTCPECHGVLTSIKEGGRLHFYCHTGHAFSADSLLASISESIEDSLWNALRTVQESIMLLNHLGDHFAEINDPKLAALYFRKAKEAETRAKLVKDVVMNHEILSSDGILQQTSENTGEETTGTV
jgi:two-component system, chemotaxis family, protein-glutamate methylesterase/glutaminase